MIDLEIAARVQMRRNVLLWLKELRTRSGIDPHHMVKVGDHEIKLSDLEHSASSIPMEDFLRIVVELGATQIEILMKMFQLNQERNQMTLGSRKEPQKIESAQVLPFQVRDPDRPQA